VSLSQFWDFWSWASLHNTSPAGDRWGTQVSKGEKDLCTGVRRAHCKSFKLDLKGERDKTRLARDKPVRGTPMFEGWCASEVLQSIISVEVGDGDPCSSKDARLIDVLETMKVPENGHVGIRAAPPKKMVGSIAQLNSIYTNAHSVGSKQEKLEAIMQRESYDIVAITETWWDGSHNWSAAMNSYKLFRSDKQGRRGSEVPLYVRECFSV